VLDRSGSMTQAPSSGGASKWDQMTAAINATVGMLQGQIKWGLEMFPSDDSCGVSASVDVAVGPMNAAPIMSAMAGKPPSNGSTPTADAVDKAGAYLAALNDGNPKYILLATDGEPNCAGSGGACTCPPGFTLMGTSCCLGPLCVPCSATSGGGADAAGAEQAITNVAAKGVNTFVIGISTDASSDATLNQMAVNGGEAQTGATKYYPVTSQQSLVTTINNIAGQIISCTLPLQQVPSKPGDVGITADGQMVPNDPTHMNGWDYGAGDMSIQFYGTWCANLQNGSVKSVQAVYACAPIS